MSKISDYGGHAHERRKAEVGNVSEDTMISLFCTDCGKMWYVSRRQRARRFRVRCPMCGGLGEESQASLDRLTGTTARERKRLVTTTAVHYYECHACEKTFRSAIALKLHWRDSHGGEMPEEISRQAKIAERSIDLLENG